MTMPTSVATFRDSTFIQGFHYPLTGKHCHDTRLNAGPWTSVDRLLFLTYCDNDNIRILELDVSTRTVTQVGLANGTSRYAIEALQVVGPFMSEFALTTSSSVKDKIPEASEFNHVDDHKSSGSCSLTKLGLYGT